MYAPLGPGNGAAACSKFFHIHTFDVEQEYRGCPVCSSNQLPDFLFLSTPFPGDLVFIILLILVADRIFTTSCCWCRHIIQLHTGIHDVLPPCPA